MNRAGRRRLRRMAGAVAREAVEGFVLAGDDGGLAKVDHPRARAILRRAIASSIRRDGAPVLRRLTEAEAATFPHIAPPDAAGAAPWLAVALGLDGRFAVTVRRLVVMGPGDHDAAVRRLLVGALTGMCASPDVPGLERPAGRA